MPERLGKASPVKREQHRPKNLVVRRGNRTAVVDIVQNISYLYNIRPSNQHVCHVLLIPRVGVLLCSLTCAISSSFPLHFRSTTRSGNGRTAYISVIPLRPEMEGPLKY